MASDLMTIYSSMIRKEIEERVNDTLGEECPVYKYIQRTIKNVRRDGGLDWKIYHNYKGGVTGVTRMTNVDETASHLSGGVNVTARTAFREYLSPMAGTRMNYYQDTVEMARIDGVIPWDIDVEQVDMLAETMPDFATDHIRGAISGISRAYNYGLFTIDDTSRQYFQVAESPTTTTSTAVVGAKNGSVSLVYPGLRVSLYRAGAALGDSDGDEMIVVDTVDPLNETVTLRTLSAGYDMTNVAEDDEVCLYQSYGKSFLGFESYMKGSGTVRGLSLTTYPHMKSFVKAIDGPLTQSDLLTILSKFEKALSPFGVKVRKLVTTQGVLNTFMLNYHGLMTMDVSGKPLNVSNTGYTEPGFTWNGIKYGFLTTDAMAASRLYGLDLEGNYHRYVLPRLKKGGSLNTGGAKAGEMVPSEVVWVAPAVMQSQGVFAPYFASSGAVTSGLQAPWYAIGQIVPERVQGIVLTGLTETESSPD